MTLLRDRYELLDIVGSGGQGEVWLALDHQHERRVAITKRTVRSDSEREVPPGNVLAGTVLSPRGHFLAADP